MQPLSTAAAAALKAGNAGVISSATVLAGGEPVPGFANIVVSDYQVTVDRSASYRRRFSLTLALTQPGMIPTSTSHPLTPFGNELQVTFGIVPPGGTPYFFQTCTGPMTTVTIEDTGSDIVAVITGYDRSWTVDASKFLVPYVVAAGADAVATMEGIVSSVLFSPRPVFNMSPSPGGATVPAVTFKEGSGPWASLLTVADAVGMEAYADVLGIFCARPIPDPTMAPTSWSFDDRVSGAGGMKSCLRTWTREGSGGTIPNNVIVSGSSSTVQPPVRAAATDSSPSSPTYIGGPYGDIPQFITSSVVTTVAQAQVAANNELAAQLGLVEQLSITCWPNPAFDVDDVVYCHRGRLGVDGLYVVDAVANSTRHDGQSVLTCRRVP